MSFDLRICGLSVTKEDGVTTLNSDLNRERSQCCDTTECCYDCDNSNITDEDENPENVAERLRYNNACDFVEYIVLHFSDAGIFNENNADKVSDILNKLLDDIYLKVNN